MDLKRVGQAMSTSAQSYRTLSLKGKRLRPEDFFSGL